MGQEDSYREAWEAAVKASGLLLPKCDELTSYAIQSWCSLSLNQMSLLRHCLRAQLRSALFSTEYQISQVVGLEHVVPVTGTYQYGSEKIEWSDYNETCWF
jgi:hypothetical protein